MQPLRSYQLLVTWQALRKKAYLPLMMAVQTLFSLGIVLGYPLLFPTLDRTSIYLIATGAPAISMISVGLVALPQTVGEQKSEGSLAYMRSLPVPRLAYLVADLTVWLAIVIPGVILGVLVGALRFGLDLQVSPLVVPAMLMVALTATCVGYALASVLPYMLTVIVTQAIVVFVFMFSPLTFLPDKLPEVVHSVLPIQAMGEVTRGTIAPNEFPLPMGSFLTLAVWCVLGFAVTYAAMTRRG
ncbi:MAG TPA: ABC transporter permease [Candidatus Limnocylindrales bacterium]|jgi:ABC-2 type transport system permease protein